MHVSPEPAELRHDGRRFEAASMGECRGELGAPIERVMALAGLDLHLLGGDGRTLLGGERLDRRALGLDAQTGRALLCSRDAKVAHKDRAAGCHKVLGRNDARCQATSASRLLAGIWSVSFLRDMSDHHMP